MGWVKEKLKSAISEKLGDKLSLKDGVGVFFGQQRKTGIVICFQSNIPKTQYGIICSRTIFTIEVAKKLNVSILIK